MLPPETLSQMRTSFASKNIYMTSSLNEFGFCDYLEDPLAVATPPVRDPLTESEAVEIVRNFVSKNKSETGVENPDDLTFSQISSTTGYAGIVTWHVRTSHQEVDDIEVMYSGIICHITNREVTCCVGNWYPDIYIPEKFNISQTKAITDLIGKTVSHYTFGGDVYYVTISKADIEKSTINLKILPITSDDKIELKVAWLINIPNPVYYQICVDVMTGEIIGEAPTIIS
jgi:Zn-dependent metalloprotease